MQYYATNIAKTNWKEGGQELLSGYFPYIELRGKLAALQNAGANEISLTQNAHMGMNFISNGLELKEGDDIDHLNVAYVKCLYGPIDVVVGRQLLAWGSGYNFNPTDIFNAKPI